MLALPIVTPRLRIDRLAPDDAAAFASYRNEPAVARYQGWTTPYEVERAVAAIAADAADTPGAPGSAVNLALRLDGALVGDVYLAVDADEPTSCEVGVTLAPAAQGRGLAIEAVGALLDAVFAPRSSTRRAVAFIDERNAPSLALFDRLGFAREGVEQGEVHMGLAADEWRRRRSHPHTVAGPVGGDEEQR